jgi:hypothetical protein
MTDKHSTRLCAMALCFFTASRQCLADEVLYCVDTAVTGFKWNQSGQASSSQFGPERFTIKIVSNTERIVTQMVGDIAGQSLAVKCRRSFMRSSSERISCDDGTGAEPWLFYRNTYTRVFLAGPPAGGSDPNITIAYGTCTKF